jgi:hypothetical protein
MNIECNFDLKIAVERQRSFKDFTIEDILSFLDRFRRAESVDPLHKWICTYNNYSCIYLRSSNGCIILISNQIQDKNRL